MENPRSMNYGQLALTLTILDKEAHLAGYYDSIRTDDDKYVESIRQVQSIMLAGIPSEHMDEFFKNNEHLRHLLHEYVKIIGNDEKLEVLENV